MMPVSTDLFAIIPADKTDAVKAAITQCLPGKELTDLTLLSGGLSGSAVYKLSMADQAYLLKLSTPRAADAVASSAWTFAADAGIAPGLYVADPVQGIFISDFIKNKPVRGVFSPDLLAEKMAASIKAVHAIPARIQDTDPFTVLDGLISAFKSDGKLSAPVLDECFQYYEELKNKYPRSDKDKVFSHNDLNPNNILCDGAKIWFIDWDTAGYNDRFIDLANAANYFVHTEKQEQLFLNAYFGREADDHQMARLYTMRQLTRILYAMLMFRLAMMSKPDDFQHDQEMKDIDMPTFGSLMATGQVSLAKYEGQWMYGKALMNTAVDNMRTDRYKLALAAL